jgi:hypothetical protein
VDWQPIGTLLFYWMVAAFDGFFHMDLYLRVITFDDDCGVLGTGIPSNAG